MNANKQSSEEHSDPVTGEPKKGIFAFFQRIEDTVGQGTVGSIIVVVGFFLFAAWQIFFT